MTSFLFFLKFLLQGAGKTPAYKAFLGPLAKLEKKQKEDWEKAAEIDNDKKKSKKNDKGRGDVDFVEKQKFHPQQVSELIALPW